MVKCDPCARYKSRVGDQELAIAHIEPVKEGKPGLHAAANLGPMCLLNKLTYWENQVTVSPLPGHEKEVETISQEARAFRKREPVTGDILRGKARK